MVNRTIKNGVGDDKINYYKNNRLKMDWFNYFFDTSHLEWFSMNFLISDINLSFENF